MFTFSVPPTARSWAEISSHALTHNLALVRKCVGPRVEILAVVKANAYGHGAGIVVPALAHDVAIFGVANVTEAQEVASLGTCRDIMLLSPCLAAERPLAVAGSWIVTVSSAAEAAAYAEHGAVRVNFKVDTGMGRVGVWWESAESEIRALAEIPCVEVHSISTHLPCSDEDANFTRQQLDHWRGLATKLRCFVPFAKIHMLNSAGILAFAEAESDIVRAGLMIYGSSPLPGFACAPALTWKTRVTLLGSLPEGSCVSYGRTFRACRPTRTAVLAVGYADGFPRQASGQGTHVLLGGTRCPILGRVTMDQVVVDITDAPAVAHGDEAVLIGCQGDLEISVETLAQQSGTIAWDIFTGLSPRVLRIGATWVE